MSSKTICDDCKIEMFDHSYVRLSSSIRHPLFGMEFCNACFAKHWKPIQKKFSVKPKVDKS